jgi:hypothetical protein
MLVSCLRVGSSQGWYRWLRRKPWPLSSSYDDWVGRLHQRDLDPEPMFVKAFPHTSSMTRLLSWDIGNSSRREHRELQAWCERNATFPLLVSYRAGAGSNVSNRTSSPSSRAGDSGLLVEKHPETEMASAPLCAGPAPTCGPIWCRGRSKVADRGAADRRGLPARCGSPGPSKTPAFSS